MNWKKTQPPRDFVGFGIEYREPGNKRYYAVKNRLAFPGVEGDVNPNKMSSLLSPIQKFRWVHFPFNPELKGAFTYRVTPVFMSSSGQLSYGEVQETKIELQRETYPGLLNVTFTRGFIASQAFVDKFVTPVGASSIKKLLPAKADDGLDFKPTHPNADEALAWMGFEARSAILEVLDDAIKDTSAEVKVVAYDLSEAAIVSRLVKLGKRLQIIIDDSGTHGKTSSAESEAAKRLSKSAGAANVQRQHMGGLQHNKTIVVNGKKKAVVCGSTNFAWRGVYVQNNHAVILRNPHSVQVFEESFKAYWNNASSVAGFGATGSAVWNDLKIKGVKAKVAFSPHVTSNAVLASVAKDLTTTTSSLFFSLAFLYQTPGLIKNAIVKLQKDNTIFSYGISDHLVKGLTQGLDVAKPDGKMVVVAPAALEKNLPLPFKKEPKGGGGTRMHHKFLVLDFDKPSARVYLGSYNFSGAADTSNGENLLLIQDQRVATSFMVEAVRIFDHYHFRVVQAQAKKARKTLQLQLPPAKNSEKPWWDEDFRNVRKIRDRELFA